MEGSAKMNKPTTIYIDAEGGLVTEALREEMESKGYAVAPRSKGASFVVFAEDPNKVLHRLPPRSLFEPMEQIVKRIRREASKQWSS